MEQRGGARAGHKARENCRYETVSEAKPFQIYSGYNMQQPFPEIPQRIFSVRV
jgi:hypothetical protein